MTSEARLDTPQADALLALIGAQFRERAAAHPELGIQVDWSEERGSVDLRGVQPGFTGHRHSSTPGVMS